MSQPTLPELGEITWRDLTVPDADGLQAFYQAVVGWTTSRIEMGGYSDYCMHNARGEVVAGVCHARGSNASLPPLWMMYVLVDDLEARAQRCVALGGKVVDGPRDLGADRFCVIQDPAGAVIALYQKAG